MRAQLAIDRREMTRMTHPRIDEHGLRRASDHEVSIVAPSRHRAWVERFEQDRGERGHRYKLYRGQHERMGVSSKPGLDARGMSRGFPSPVTSVQRNVTGTHGTYNGPGAWSYTRCECLYTTIRCDVVEPHAKRPRPRWYVSCRPLSGRDCAGCHRSFNAKTAETPNRDESAFALLTMFWRSTRSNEQRLARDALHCARCLTSEIAGREPQYGAMWNTKIL